MVSSIQPLGSTMQGFPSNADLFMLEEPGASALHQAIMQAILGEGQCHLLEASGAAILAFLLDP